MRVRVTGSGLGLRAAPSWWTRAALLLHDKLGLLWLLASRTGRVRGRVRVRVRGRGS